MEYKFNQNVTKEDYVSFVTNHMKNSFLRPMNIVLFVISIGYLTVSPFFMPADERSFTFTFIGIGIVLLLIAMVFFAKRNAEKQYDKNEGEFKMKYEVDDEGLRYIVSEGQIERKWNELFSAVENDEYLYIYVNKNSGMLMVKRDIDDAAIQFVRDRLRANLKPKRVRIK
jgi:hypothetical protein